MTNKYVEQYSSKKYYIVKYRNSLVVLCPSVSPPADVMVRRPSVRRRRSLSVRPSTSFSVRPPRRLLSSVRPSSSSFVVRPAVHRGRRPLSVRPSVVVVFSRPSSSSSSVRPFLHRRPLSIRPSLLSFVRPSLVLVLCPSVPLSVRPIVRLVLRPVVLGPSHGVIRTSRARDACLVARIHAGRTPKIK